MSKYDKLQKPKSASARWHKSREWLRVRKAYLVTQLNSDGYVVCSIERGYGCGSWLTLKEATVDHIIKRSVRPDLMFDPSNFQVLCWSCHHAKDSGMKAA